MNNFVKNLGIEIKDINLTMAKMRLIMMEAISKYNKLKQYFTFYHLGKITKKELASAIHLWQRTLVDLKELF